MMQSVQMSGEVCSDKMVIPSTHVGLLTKQATHAMKAAMDLEDGDQLALLAVRVPQLPSDYRLATSADNVLDLPMHTTLVLSQDEDSNELYWCTRYGSATNTNDISIYAVPIEPDPNDAKLSGVLGWGPFQEEVDEDTTGYRGYTYPKWLQSPFVWYLWKKIGCRLGWHLWDETASDNDHYLYCDACDALVSIREA